MGKWGNVKMWKWGNLGMGKFGNLGMGELFAFYFFLELIIIFESTFWISFKRVIKSC